MRGYWLKCIYCGKECEYVVDGTSVCKEHLVNISNGTVPGGKDAVEVFKEYKKSIGLED